MLEAVGLSRQAMLRLPNYLQTLKKLKLQGVATVQAATVAEALELNESVVRKDFAAIGYPQSKQKTGFAVDGIIEDIEVFLGRTNMKDAVLIGVGAMGSALLSNQYFSTYGVNIVAAFDIAATKESQPVCGKPVFPLEELKRLCKRLSIRIGIIAVPEDAAQAVCDLLVSEGVLAIWNFAPVHLKVPRKVLVQNENLAASLGLLSRNLEKMLYHPNGA